VAFPPGEEFFDLPAQFVHSGDLFAGKIEAIGGNPIIDVVDPVTDKPQFFLRLIDVGSSGVSVLRISSGMRKENRVSKSRT